MLRLEGRVTLTCTDGTQITLDTRSSGVKTGYAFIDNPYWYGDPDWRFKDGDTCIGCGPDEIGALPVADAYQELKRQWDEENREIQEALDNMERQWTEESDLRRWEQTIGALYDLQDRLCRIR